jgi:hypothetical protein
MFKRIKTFFAKRKKLVLITGVSLLALGVIGGGAAFWLSSRMTPEKMLYQALSEIQSDNQYANEQVVNTDAGDMTFEAYATEDGTAKSEGSLECTGESMYGRIELKMTLRQINESVYLRYDKLAFSGGDDQALNDELNTLYNEKMVGKWIIAEDKEWSYMGYKEYGVSFDGITAASNKLSNEQIIEKMKQHKVVEILNAREVSVAGKAATEYSLMVRRSAYDKFVDSVEPRYKYKDEMLDTIFTGDTQEMTIVVDNKSKQLLSSTYSMENPCVGFAGQYDPDSVEDMPETMTVRGTASKTGKADKLEKPTEFITLKDLETSLSEEAE